MEDELLRKTFAENLNYWLSKRGKRQADMARYMNVSTATTAKWCTGKSLPRIDKIQSLCNWFMIDKSDLLEPLVIESEQDKRIKRMKAYYDQLYKLNDAGREYVLKQIDFALSQDEFKER